MKISWFAKLARKHFLQYTVHNVHIATLCMRRYKIVVQFLLTSNKLKNELCQKPKHKNILQTHNQDKLYHEKDQQTYPHGKVQKMVKRIKDDSTWKPKMQLPIESTNPKS